MEKDSKLIYDEAVKLMNSSSLEDLYNAIMQFESIQVYEDSAQKIAECNEKIEKIKTNNKAKRVEQAKQDEIQKEETKQKSKRNKIIALVIIIAIIIGAVLFKVFAIPSIRYQSALNLIDNQQYVEAINKLESLGDYKESADYLKEARYCNAVKVFESGDFSSEIGTLKNLEDYKSSKEYITYYDAINCSDLDESLEKFKSLPETMYDVKDRIDFLNELKFFVGSFKVRGEATQKLNSGDYHILTIENAFGTVTLENGNAQILIKCKEKSETTGSFSTINYDEVLLEAEIEYLNRKENDFYISCSSRYASNVNYNNGEILYGFSLNNSKIALYK